jgi:hypothetical protein
MTKNPQDGDAARAKKRRRLTKRAKSQNPTHSRRRLVLQSRFHNPCLRDPTFSSSAPTHRHILVPTVFTVGCYYLFSPFAVPLPQATPLRTFFPLLQSTRHTTSVLRSCLAHFHDEIVCSRRIPEQAGALTALIAAAVIVVTALNQVRVIQEMGWLLYYFW